MTDAVPVSAARKKSPEQPRAHGWRARSEVGVPGRAAGAQRSVVALTLARGSARFGQTADVKLPYNNQRDVAK